MKSLSKSKLLAFRQCPRRLWLQIHGEEPGQLDPGALARQQEGDKLGEIARQIYDSRGHGNLIDRQSLGISRALERTAELLPRRRPIFEAGFEAHGAMAFADVLLPVRRQGQDAWRMVEVKSSSKPKPYHFEDVAIQSLLARAAGLPLASVHLAHVDKTWVYSGGEDYRGLLMELDLTQETIDHAVEARKWVEQAHAIARKRVEPAVAMGSQCNKPFACEFQDHCSADQPSTEYPIEWIPRRRTKALTSRIEQDGIIDMRGVPDSLLNDEQLRVKTQTLAGKTYFDRSGAIASLGACKLPAYFLDFETISFAVPRWKGTRPHQKIPFQFSLHRLGRSGRLDHRAHLDLSGADPSRQLTEALIGGCGERGPIFVYSESFEKGCVLELAKRFPRMSRALMGIHERIIDLLPVTKAHYYRPSQQGSWSLKAVLPAMVPGIAYDQLVDVQDGTSAMLAYRDATSPEASSAQKERIEKQLLEYCHLDTYGLARVWQILAGRADLSL